MTVNGIRRCNFCNRWLTATELVSDPRLKPIGMIFKNDSSKMAYYVYQHEIPGCGTSFLVPVRDFQRFIREAIPPAKLALSDCCERRCVTIEDLSECKQPCYFAPFRRFLLEMIDQKRIQTRKKWTDSYSEGK